MCCRKSFSNSSTYTAGESTPESTSMLNTPRMRDVSIISPLRSAATVASSSCRNESPTKPSATRQLGGVAKLGPSRATAVDVLPLPLPRRPRQLLSVIRIATAQQWRTSRSRPRTLGCRMTQSRKVMMPTS